MKLRATWPHKPLCSSQKRLPRRLVFWTALSTRRCRLLRQNGLQPQWQLTASIVWCRVKESVALLFKKSVLLAHTLGGSRTARVKILLVKKQGGNWAQKESTRRVEIAPAVPNPSSTQKAADRL